MPHRPVAFRGGYTLTPFEFHAVTLDAFGDALDRDTFDTLAEADDAARAAHDAGEGASVMVERTAWIVRGCRAALHAAQEVEAGACPDDIAGTVWEAEPLREYGNGGAVVPDDLAGGVHE